MSFSRSYLPGTSRCSAECSKPSPIIKSFTRVRPAKIRQITPREQRPMHRTLTKRKRLCRPSSKRTNNESINLKPNLRSNTSPRIRPWPSIIWKDVSRRCSGNDIILKSNLEWGSRSRTSSTHLNVIGNMRYSFVSAARVTMIASRKSTYLKAASWRHREPPKHYKRTTLEIKRPHVKTLK